MDLMDLSRNLDKQHHSSDYVYSKLFCLC